MTIIARLKKCCTTATAFAASAAMVVLPSTPAHAQSISLIRDTEIEAVMRGYTDPLLDAAGLDRNSVGFYLVGNNEFNAFVTRGQNIFMHTGTIVIAETPGEIKAVIAHEIGHIEGAHLVRFGDGSRGAMATMIATLGLGIVAAMAGAGAGGAAIMASAPQFATLDMLRYTRTQEAAADQAAITFLDRTGQSSRGLVSTFERFRYQEVMSEARRYEYFRSHPLSSQRIDAMRRRVEASPYADVEDSPEEIAELRRIQAKIIGFTVAPAQVFHRYPESNTSLEAVYARAVAYFRQGRLELARERLAQLIEMEPENPFFHELEGQMLYESGRIADSVAPHRRSVELMPDAPLLRVNLAASLIGTNEADALDEAVSHLRFALAREQENGWAWFQLALAHEARGETALAQLATAERYFAVGNNMQAFVFASRARDELEGGTPAWVRASELIAVAEPTPQEIREWNRAQQERRQFVPVSRNHGTGLSFN
ncbi:M48 family metalloprotease [Glycocaulis sp.]|uniref:M48 family metalloprotease n=1 Tax=Glycocaulis sp. TaxID=1969725 RepID=UPI003F718387